MCAWVCERRHSKPPMISITAVTVDDDWRWAEKKKKLGRCGEQPMRTRPERERRQKSTQNGILDEGEERKIEVSLNCRKKMEMKLKLIQTDKKRIKNKKNKKLEAITETKKEFSPFLFESNAHTHKLSCSSRKRYHISH